MARRNFLHREGGTCAIAPPALFAIPAGRGGRHEGITGFVPGRLTGTRAQHTTHQHCQEGA